MQWYSDVIRLASTLAQTLYSMFSRKTKTKTVKSIQQFLVPRTFCGKNILGLRGILRGLGRTRINRLKERNNYIVS